MIVESSVSRFYSQTSCRCAIIYLLDLVLNNIVHLYYLPGNVTFNPRGLNASNCTLKFAERVNVGVPKFKITSKNRRKIILASDFGHSSTLSVY